MKNVLFEQDIPKHFVNIPRITYFLFYVVSGQSDQ